MDVCCATSRYRVPLLGRRELPDYADDSALRECHESRGTRYSERHSAQNEAAVGAVRGHLQGRPDPAYCLLDSWYTYRGARLVPGFAGGLSTTAPLPRPQRLVPADRAHPHQGDE